MGAVEAIRTSFFAMNAYDFKSVSGLSFFRQDANGWFQWTAS